MSPAPLSETAEDYLKEIHRLESAHGRATTSTLAASLGVSPPSVTSMLKKLATLKLVAHEPYRGATLTSAGRKAAVEVIRHHRLLEQYLAENLGMPIDDGGEIIGELFLANSCKPGGFTADDEELVRLLAAHAAIALVNARLYKHSRELSIVEERNRIARELHDAVSQKLFSLRLTADAASALLDRDPDRARTELENVRRLAADASTAGPAERIATAIASCRSNRK